MTNKELASHFRLLADLIELTGGNEFKSKSYQSAAFKISKWPVDIFALPEEDILKIEGIGQGILSKIHELKTTGGISELDEIAMKVPVGVIEMLKIKGIGPKKVRVIWNEMGIETVGELLYACNENRLITIKGFGEKLQKEIIQSIEFNLSSQGKQHYYIAERIAKSIADAFEKAFGAGNFSVTAELRRLCEIVDVIEFVVKDAPGEKVQEVLSTLEFVSTTYIEENTVKFKLHEIQDGIIHLSNADTYIYTLWETTGSADHINLLKYTGPQTITAEEDIYKAQGLYYITPELREGRDEIELAAKQDVSTGLLELKDIKGMLHNHSTYSDGVHTLKEMAEYCKNQGWEYLGISDHSQTAAYAGGLKPERVAEQHIEIDKLNQALAPFKILKGIESDILSDGSLDYTDDVLASFDFVVASIHQNFKMTEEQATERLIKAIENPYTTILGHPTGRLLLMRKGYPINHEAVIDACAKHGVVIELNANPHRLDLDWKWIKYATDQGVMISINPDAHSINGFNDTCYGVLQARKGYLKPAQTFNCLSLEQLENHITNRKAKLQNTIA